MNLRNFCLALAAAFLFSGCATTISNLTPSRLPRNENNLYPFEVQYETAQKSVRENTIEAHVMIGEDRYRMQPGPVNNRWEALVPIPPGTNYLYYRYKFDYQYDRIPSPGSSSRLSPTYQLEIVDR